MKPLIAILGPGLSLTAFAHCHGEHRHWKKMMNEMSFEDAKKHMQGMAQQNLAIMNQFQSCVQDATDKKALRKCQTEKMNADEEEMESMHEEETEKPSKKKK